MIKFLLIVWIGYSDSQSFDTSVWNSQAECEAAKKQIEIVLDSYRGATYRFVACTRVEPKE